MKRLGILLLCAVSCTVHAEPAKLLEELKAVLRSTQEDSSKAGQQEQSRSEILLESISSSAAENDQSGDYSQSLIEAVRRVANTSRSTKAVQISRDLLVELSSQRDAKANATKARFDKAMRTALVRGLDATKAEDLDEPLTELAALQTEISTEPSRRYENLRIEATGADWTQHLLIAIQDGFLAKTKFKHSSRNTNPLDQIQSFGEIPNQPMNNFIPRSELVRKLQGVIERVAKTLPSKVLTRNEYDDQIQSWAVEIKTLNDLEQTMTKIDELNARQREYGGYFGDSNMVDELRSCRRIYNDFQAGIGTTINFANRASSPTTDILNGVRYKLLLFALPRVLQLGEQLPPGENDTVSSYLNRVLTHARDTSNWQLLLHVLEAANNAYVTSLGGVEDRGAVQQFLAGLNLERAHQYSTAVVAYLACLKSGSSVIPAEKIGTILSAIKKEHPEDYETGVQISQMPADGRSSRYIPLQRPWERQLSGESRPSSVISVPPKPKSDPTPKSQEDQTNLPAVKAETPKADIPTKEAPIKK